MPDLDGWMAGVDRSVGDGGGELIRVGACELKRGWDVSRSGFRLFARLSCHAFTAFLSEALSCSFVVSVGFPLTETRAGPYCFVSGLRLVRVVHGGGVLITVSSIMGEPLVILSWRSRGGDARGRSL